jgi:pilus assembly protein FimV
VSAAERTKVLEAAQKHLAKGNYDKAIAEFRKIVQTDPTDVRTWLKIGDLYTRKGSRREAIETYAKVAQQYGEQGFFLKAVAVYKQILKLDPSRLDIQLKLAEMYEMLQLVSDALATYEHVAGGYARSGDVEKALTTLAKMTELDPENIPVRIKFAEALSKAQKTKEAAAEFEAGATLLKAQGRIDDFIKVSERLLFHRPEDMKLARELAALYLERSDPKRALSKLQICFKADAKDTATLELLAEAFNQLGQLPKTISVYREVARIHQEANRHEDRARTLKKIIELDPGDAEARQALASYAQGGGAAQGGAARKDIAPPRSAVVEPSRSQVRESEAPELAEDEASEEELESDEDVQSDEDVESDDVLLDGDADDDDMIIVDEEEAEDEIPAPVAAKHSPPARSMPSVPPDVQREAQIARLLTECDVFLRYGLRTKVIEQLHAVLEIEPMHVEARERLKDLHLRMGQTEEAIGELLTLADILAEKESAAAVLYLREIIELDPEHIDARARLGRLGGLTPSKAPPKPPSEPVLAAPPEPSPQSSPPPEDDGLFAPPRVEQESRFEDATSDELAPPMPPAPAGDDGVLFVEEDERTEAITTANQAIAKSAAPAETDEELLTELDEADDDNAPFGQTEAKPRPAIMPPPSQQLVIPKPRMVPSPGDPLAPMSPREFDEVPLRPSTPGPPPPSARASLPPGEVEEILDEVDFYLAQGLFDEALGTLSDAHANHPKNALIAEKLREVEQLAANAAANPPLSSAPPSTPDQSFELAEKLAEELDDEGVEPTTAGSDVLDVESVFAQFKKGVEQQVGLEDTETHFDLGIAYKEMGLLDDAMNEFRLCVTNPQRLCIAETMIGLCHIEKGDVAEAISHFKKGLYAETKTDREELGLYFELGHAYELLHDPKEALYYYQKVQKRDPVFRDVGRRIQNLAQPQAPEGKPTTAMNPEDIDRAFDDLVGED